MAVASRRRQREGQSFEPEPTGDKTISSARGQPRQEEALGPGSNSNPQHPARARLGIHKTGQAQGEIWLVTLPSGC
ncbi:hypothetical protein L3X38_032455 [Prunus dulcis]|uniref:Uncharacterized protein n=1 Tax=Prunus dulcis TaxID=3755 RepID=A0AAD4VF66_PRUDU|nr:hypothetical protein L3X38_032455 [Prunus dulcis]